MSSQSGDNRHAVKRVVLPSGKTIEIVYFTDPGETPAPPAQPPRRTGDLHMCPECSGGLVYPLDWEEAGDAAWSLTLRCPDCEWLGVDVYAQDVVERLDEELDRGTQVLVRDLKQLVHANMEDEVERFISALRADAIHPMDF